MPNTAQSPTRGQTEAVREIVGLTSDLNRLMATDGSDAWMDLKNITVKQLKVMLILSQRGQETVTALAERLGVHISTVTGILDRLVQQKLVQREEDPGDRRHVISRLTAEGNDVLHRLYYGAGQEELSRRLERLDAEDLRALERGLRALIGSW